MLLVQVVGGAKVHRLHPGIGGGLLVGSEGPTALEHLRVGFGPLAVAAGEIEVDIAPNGLNPLGKGLGLLSAADNTQS